MSLPISEEFDCFGVVSHARLAPEMGEVVVRARYTLAIIELTTDFVFMSALLQYTYRLTR